MRENISVMVVGLRGFPMVQGGVETHAEHLYAELAEMGCQVEVLVRDRSQPLDNPPEWKGIRFTRLWAPRKKRFEAIVHTFFGVLYAAWKRPDVLHIHAIGPALLTPIARLFGLNVVVTHHGADYERQKWGRVAKQMLRLGERFGMRFAHQRIVISQGIRSAVASKYACDSALIPNGVTLPDVPRSVAALEQFGLVAGKYVLLVSRLVPEKRHADLIEAFALAGLRGWKLVLVGDADHPDAYARSVLAAAAGIDEVVCTGFQSGLALRELYAHAGMFVLPSSHEGLPIALLEALSYGLPSIASDIPANQEVINPRVQLFPVGNIEALAGRLRRQSESVPDPEGARTAQRLLAETYRWSTIARDTRHVYERVLGQTAPAAVAAEPAEAIIE